MTVISLYGEKSAEWCCSIESEDKLPICYGECHMSSVWVHCPLPSVHLAWHQLLHDRKTHNWVLLWISNLLHSVICRGVWIACIYGGLLLNCLISHCGLLFCESGVCPWFPRALSSMKSFRSLEASLQCSADRNVRLFIRVEGIYLVCLRKWKKMVLA